MLVDHSSINWKAGKPARDEKVNLYRGQDEPPARRTRSRMKAAQPEEEEQVEHDEHIEDELEDDVYIVQKVLEHRTTTDESGKHADGRTTDETTE